MHTMFDFNESFEKTKCDGDYVCETVTSVLKNLQLELQSEWSVFRWEDTILITCHKLEQQLGSRGGFDTEFDSDSYERFEVGESHLTDCDVDLKVDSSEMDLKNTKELLLSSSKKLSSHDSNLKKKNYDSLELDGARDVEKSIIQPPLQFDHDEPKNKLISLNENVVERNSVMLLGRKRYSCDDCGYSEHHKSTFNRHLLTHAKNKEVLRCSDCNYTSVHEG
jgi:rubrerythrin